MCQLGATQSSVGFLIDALNYDWYAIRKKKCIVSECEDSEKVQYFAHFSDLSLSSLRLELADCCL